MAEHWLKTDEREAASALEAVAEWSGRVATKVDYWKWVVFALHNATQGFMVLSLRGSNGLARSHFEMIEESYSSQFHLNVSNVPLLAVHRISRPFGLLTICAVRVRVRPCQLENEPH